MKINPYSNQDNKLQIIFFINKQILLKIQITCFQQNKLRILNLRHKISLARDNMHMLKTIQVMEWQRVKKMCLNKSALVKVMEWQGVNKMHLNKSVLVSEFANLQVDTVKSHSDVIYLINMLPLIGCIVNLHICSIPNY